MEERIFGGDSLSIGEGLLDIEWVTHAVGGGVGEK